MGRAYDELRRLIHLVRHDEISTRGDIVRRAVVRLVYGILATVSGVILIGFVTSEVASKKLLVVNGCVLSFLAVVDGVLIDRRRLTGERLLPALVFISVSNFVVLTATVVILKIIR